MRNITVTILFTAMLAGANAHASDSNTMERVKTGILPSGGIYSLYDVSCADRASASVARLEGGTRWCAGRGAVLDCYRKSTDALAQACAGSARLAAAETSLEGTPTGH